MTTTPEAPAHIPTANPRLHIAGEFQTYEEILDVPGDVLAQIAEYAQELHAPIPDGLTSSQRAAIQGQKARLRVEMASAEGVVWGYIAGLRRAGKLTHADFIALHEALLTVVQPPRVAEREEASDGNG